LPFPNGRSFRENYDAKESSSALDLRNLRSSDLASIIHIGRSGIVIVPEVITDCHDPLASCFQDIDFSALKVFKKMKPRVRTREEAYRGRNLLLFWPS